MTGVLIRGDKRDRTGESQKGWSCGDGGRDWSDAAGSQGWPAAKGEGPPGGSVVKNPPPGQEMPVCPWVGGSPGGGKGNPLQDSFLENPVDRGAWRATVHGHKRVRQDLGSKEQQSSWKRRGGITPRGFRRTVALLMPWFRTSALQDCERLRFCCF